MSQRLDPVTAANAMRDAAIDVVRRVVGPHLAETVASHLPLACEVVDDDDDDYPPGCCDPRGHVWAISEETDRSYCENCGADGDA